MSLKYFDDKDYIEYLKEDMSENTCDIYLRTLDHLFQYLEEQGIDFQDINVLTLERWLRSKGIGKTSKKTYLYVVSSYIGYMQTRDLFDGKNHAFLLLKERKNRNVKSKKHGAVPQEDLKKMLKVCIHPQDRAIVLTLAKTGCRASELVKLVPDDIDEKYEWITIHDRKGDNGDGYKDTRVPVDNELKTALMMWLSIRPKGKYLFMTSKSNQLQRQRLNEKLKQIAKMAGLTSHVSTHMMRYSFVSLLNAGGMNETMISILRGDSQNSSNMTRYYTEFTDQQIREQYLKSMPRLLS